MRIVEMVEFWNPAYADAEEAVAKLAAATEAYRQSRARQDYLKRCKARFPRLGIIDERLRDNAGFCISRGGWVDYWTRKVEAL
jgi:hypothetical protein